MQENGNSMLGLLRDHVLRGNFVYQKRSRTIQSNAYDEGCVVAVDSSGAVNYLCIWLCLVAQILPSKRFGQQISPTNSHFSFIVSARGRKTTKIASEAKIKLNLVQTRIFFTLKFNF